MNIQEIKSFIETNKEDKEVAGLIAELQVDKPLTIEGVKSFLESDGQGIAYLQSYGDKRVTDGIKTFKEKNLQGLIEAEITKRNPNKTPEQIKIEELERKFNEAQRESAIKDLKLKYSNTLATEGLTDFAEYIFAGTTEEEISGHIEKIKKAKETLVAKEVSEKLKASSYTPPKDENKGNNALTREKLSKMSLLEQMKFKADNPDTYKKLMG